MMVTILNKLVMWGNTRPTRGAFLICTEMCGSGPRTGTRRLIPPATRWWILAVRHRARIGSYGVVPGAPTGRTCVLLSASAHPRHPPLAPLASVLVSNSSSQGSNGRKDDGHGGRGRRSGTGLDQRGGSPKGPCQARGAPA